MNARKLPSFSWFGSYVDMGALASIRPDTDYTRIARRLALNFQRIQFGEDPGTFPVSLRLGERLVINMRTGRKIGYLPTWNVLSEADMIHAESDEVGQRWNLETTIKTAIANNPDVATSRASAAAQNQTAKRATSQLCLRLISPLMPNG